MLSKGAFRGVPKRHLFLRNKSSLHSLGYSNHKQLKRVGAALLLSAIGGYQLLSQEVRAEEPTENVSDEATIQLITEELKKEVPPPQHSKFWSLLLHELPLFILAALAIFGSSMLGISLQKLVGEIIDLVKIKGTSGLSDPIFKFIGIVVAHSSLLFLAHSLITIATEKIAGKIRRQLFSKMLDMDIEYFDKTKVSVLLSRIDSDITETRRCIKYLVSDGVQYSTQIIGGIYGLLSISPKLTLITAIAVPTVVFFGTIYGKILRYLSTKVREIRASVNANSTEKLQNIRTVRSFSNEEYEKAKYNNEDLEYEQASIDFGLGLGGYRALSSLAVNGLVTLLLGYGGYLAQSGEITSGGLTYFLVTAMGFQKSLGHSSVLVGKVVNGMSSVDKIFSIINMEPKIKIRQGIELPRVNGKIKFDHISFFYPNRPKQTIFEDFTFEVEEGKTVALVGPSGSGKSTVASLLMRFYDPNQGFISLDGVDLALLDPTWLRKQIGVVSQEPTLFHASIFENIAYSNPRASTEDIMEAARKAKCEDFIHTFPDGYNTIVGDRGLQLSGGQKQRIAIARAILKDPKILILDEATSALDNTTEEEVQRELVKLMEHRTVLVIAHRLSTIRNADHIAVLRKVTATLLT